MTIIEESQSLNSSHYGVVLTKVRERLAEVTGKVENLHGHVNCNLQYVNLDLHSL